MNLDFSAHVVVPDYMLVQKIVNEVVLLNMNSERYFGLEDVGASMWEALTTSESLQQAYATLSEEYNVEPTRLRQDLEKFLEQLIENELVKIESPTPQE